jgi:hypothetical protein
MQLAGLDLMDLKVGFRAPGPGESLVSVLFALDRMQDREIWFNPMGNNALRQGKRKAVISSGIDRHWQLYSMA